MEYVQAFSCLTSCVVDPVKQIIWYSRNVEAMRIKAGIINGKLQPYDALKQRWEGFKFSDPAEASIQRAKDWCQKVNQILDYESIKCTCNPKTRYDIFHQIARLMGSYDDILFDLETYNEEVKRVKVERKQSGYFRAKSPSDKQLIKYKQQDLVISEELIVGVKKELGRVIEALMDSQKSKWVGIWGMGGIGKTTLAKLVHNNVKIREHFQDAILWITVGIEASQDYITKELCSIVNQEILGEVPETSEFEYMKKNIVDALRKQRCLLILDDVWTSESLEKLDLVREHDSKILVTTRKPSLLKRVHAESYKSRLLSQVESRGLFFKHVFGSQVPGPINTLQGEMAEKMADTCGGLPLALEITGKAMAVYNDDRTLDNWERCLRSFQEGGFLDLDDEGAQDILFKKLKFSYDELTTIKTIGKVVQECFLYVAAFPEDHKIFVDDLIKCWRGEDLVGPDSWKEGFNILTCLESRALVQVDRSNQDYETVAVHDMIHKLCIQILEGSFGDQMEHEKWCDFNIQSTLSSGQIMDHKYLRKVSSRSRSITRLPSTMRVTQVLLLDGNKSFASLDDEAIEQLKEVKVLSLQDTSIQVIPESISKLIHLRTLDLKRTQVSRVPSSIFSMHTLRYLNLGSAQFYVKDFPFEEVYRLSLLEDLTLRFDTEKGTVVDCSGLTHLTNLRLLDIRCRNMESVMKLPCLSRLLKLERLVLDGHMDFTDTGIIIKSGSQSQLQNLKYCSINGALTGWKWPGILEGSHRLTTLKVWEYYIEGLAEGIFHSHNQEQGNLINLQWLDKCTRLNLLHIYTKLGGADVFSLPSLPMLKELRVGHRESLQPAAAQAVTRSFPLLEIFQIISRKQLRDDIFTSLFEATQLTGKKYIVITAEEKWHHIPNSTLHIDSLDNLTVLGDVEVVIADDLDFSSSRLRYLEIRNNNVLVHLPRSIANLPQLEYLHLYGCTNLKSIAQEDVESPNHLFPSLSWIIFKGATPHDVHIPAWLKDRIKVKVAGSKTIRSDG